MLTVRLGKEYDMLGSKGQYCNRVIIEKACNGDLHALTRDESNHIIVRG